MADEVTGVSGTPTEGGEVETPIVETPEVPVFPQEVISDVANTPTPPEPAPRPEPLSDNEVQNLRLQLVEQRKIQSGLDRANTQLQDQLQRSNERIQELENMLSQSSTAITGDEDLIQSLEDRIQAQQQELQQWQEQAQAALGMNERYKVLLGEYSEGPLANLVQADALPQAENLDEFRQKLNVVVDGFTSQGQAQHFMRIGGSKPPASPPAGPSQSPDLAEINRRMNVALDAGNMDEYHKLKDQWYELINATGLPGQGGPKY